MFKNKFLSCARFFIQKTYLSNNSILRYTRTLCNVSKSKSNGITENSIAKDEDIILDIEKEKYLFDVEENEVDKFDCFNGLNLKRGKSGVFDIEDLVEALRKENSEHIFVANVPKQIKYVDYIVVVSGRSQKHMQAIAYFIRHLYKQKRNKGDLLPKIEGENSQDWIAMDLGNIALHVFSKKARIVYDLDTLWSVGSKYDDEYNKKEQISEMLSKYSTPLSEFQPAN
ncbi:hypothetical protein GWI33_012344 [Rhynchophorus ferrugineus]|uniref:Mitochondrial assembly of ribosomal large subunit protein 1 n=1 Tax=Rhynchophorus ferrugineus TaxID=354439 RepID=A0A834IS43_RHYFE|nr:hypothetical protein GWI33_012344 [Rhynchophorus ferrugineus]